MIKHEFQAMIAAFPCNTASVMKFRFSIWKEGNDIILIKNPKPIIHNAIFGTKTFSMIHSFRN